MNIAQVKTLAPDTKGIEINGVISNIYDPRSHEGKYGAYTTQNFVLKDDGDTVLVSLYNRQIEKSYIDKGVTLTNATIRTYPDKVTKETRYIVDLKKGSEIFLDDGPRTSATPPLPQDTTKEAVVQQAKKTYCELMLEATNEIRGTICDENFKKMWAEMNVGDMTSEDVRAFIISNIISKQRG